VPPLAAEGTVAVMVKTFALVAVCTVCAVMEIAIQAFHFNNVLAVVGTPALGVPDYLLVIWICITDPCCLLRCHWSSSSTARADNVSIRRDVANPDMRRVASERNSGQKAVHRIKHVVE